MWGNYFFIAFLLSAAGSLPPGMITLTTAQRTIQNGRQAGISFAFGASITAFFYTYLALLSLELFEKHSTINQYLQIIATFSFFILGTYFLLKKNKTNQTTPDFNYFDFAAGMLTSAMNVLVIPFWIFLAIWLKSYDFAFDDQLNLLSFSLGSSLGGLLIFLAYVWLSEFIVKRLHTITPYIDRSIGLAFLALGIYQLSQWV